MSQLVREGHEVHALVRPGSSLTRIEDPEGPELHHWELSDGGITDLVRTTSPDLAFHLAWFAEPGRYLSDVPQNLGSLRASVELVGALIDAGCRRLVLAGTCLEGLDLKRASIYASAKRALHVLAEGIEASTMTTVCAHIFYLFGPHEDPRRVIPQVITSLLANAPIKVTRGEQIRDYLHVEDVASALCALSGSHVTGTADICSGGPVTLRSMFESIAEKIGRPELLRIGEVEYGDNEIFEAVGDPGHLEGIGWRPTRSLDEGIAQTIEWWRTHGKA